MQRKGNKAVRGTDGPVRLQDLLAGHAPNLARLVRRAAQTSTLAQTVRRGLPEAARAHLLSANRRASTVILLVDSPNWAARLRFSAPDILTFLRNEQVEGVEEVQIRVDPAAASRTPRP